MSNVQISGYPHLEGLKRIGEKYLLIGKLELTIVVSHPPPPPPMPLNLIQSNAANVCSVVIRTYLCILQSSQPKFLLLSESSGNFE